MNLISDPESAIRGVLWRTDGPWFTLKQPALVKRNLPPVVLDGELILHRSNIAFLQILPPDLMAIVSSYGSLQAYGDDPYRTPADAGARVSALDGLSPNTYANLYRSQPNVRTVVDFLARNIAQLGIHVFRRVSDLDRERLNDHELVTWLTKPNPSTTRYRLIESLMQDLGIYFNAYWLKVRLDGRLGLVRLPPEGMTVEGWLMPEAFVWTKPDGSEIRIAPKEIVYFNGYDPLDPIMGLSPLETLRAILAEDCAQTTYRKEFWANSSRLEGVVTRPGTAPKWTPEQKQSWREQWQAKFTGPGKAGQTAVLEDGMTFTPMSYSARESEFNSSRKLTREEVAAAYHVPLPMVGILDHATFSNIKEQHKQLYQDCLGPWLEMIVGEIERQLLIESADQDDVYVEFNIAEKLKGSFEEQASSLQTLVGRPVMTANEGRARLNLPSITDDASANELALPMNTATGSVPTDPAQAVDAVALAAAPVIRDTWVRQRSRLAKVASDDRAAAFEVARWDRELAHALEPLYLAAGCTEGDAAARSAALASTVNADTLQLLVAGEDAFSPAREAALYA